MRKKRRWRSPIADITGTGGCAWGGRTLVSPITYKRRNGKEDVERGGAEVESHKKARKTGKRGES
jgi:hypothetical protein